MTGQYAQYGEQFKEAFDLAVEQVNADGGINGHPVALKYEDSQSDPKQSVTVAQKFVNDPDIVLVFGDYSSAASIPASPIYTAGKLAAVRLQQLEPGLHRQGHASTSGRRSITTSATYTWTADYIKKQGVDSVGVTLPQHGRLGHPRVQRVQGRGRQGRPEDHRRRGRDPASDDYRPSLTKAVAGNPDAVRPHRLRPGCREDRHAAACRSATTGRSTAARTRSPSTAPRMPRASINGAEFLETNPDPRCRRS